MVPFSIIFVGEFCVTIYIDFYQVRKMIAHHTLIFVQK